MDHLITFFLNGKVDFEFKEDCWSKMMRSEDDWNRNLEIIARWSPYSNKEDLLEQVYVNIFNK